MYVCVCVHERERERERENKNEEKSKSVSLIDAKLKGNEKRRTDESSLPLYPGALHHLSIILDEFRN